MIREPSGRLSRSVEEAIGAVPPAAIKRLRDAALRGMADEVWGTELGRLHLAGKIDHFELTAGRRWARLVEEYHRAICSPKPYPKSGFFFGNPPKGAEPDADSAAGRKIIKQAEGVMQAMREAHGILLSFGLNVERAVRAVSEANEAPVGTVGLDNLVYGLNALADHWGLRAASHKRAS